MRALKILVVVMGVLIVAGTVALAVAIVQRVGGGAPVASPVALGQPAGTRIAAIAAIERGLAVLVVRPDGATLVLLVDPQRGRVLGEIRAER